MQSPGTGTRTIMWVCLHMLSSASMIIVNKAAVAKCPPTAVVLIQALVSVFILLFQSSSSSKSNGTTLRSTLSSYNLVRWAPVSLLFVAMLFSSSMALQRVPVETVIVFRTLVALWVAIIERVFLKQYVPLKRVLAICVMVIGAALYAKLDLHFDSFGYAFILLNTVATCSYNLFTKSRLSSLKFTPQQCSLLNNFLSLPMLAGLSIALGELGPLAHFVIEMKLFDGAVVAVSCVVGFAISFAGFNVQSRVSATSFTVAVNFSKVVSILLSVAVFNTQLSAGMVSGLALSLLGAFGYALIGTTSNAGVQREKKE